MVAVNKADIFREKLKHAVRDYKSALHILTDASPSWHPPVVTCSGLTGEGVDELWSRVEKHRKIMTGSGEREARRTEQRLTWLDTQTRDRLLARFYENMAVQESLPSVREALRRGEITVSAATERLLALLK
jgi:LAO/AO transport system kinase